MLQVTAMTKDDVENCPIRNVLTNINGKWQPLILLSLEGGELRFSAIKRAIGDITQRVQTQNLRTLERDGYIIRTVHPGPPLAVSYRMTEMGKSMVQALKPMVAWAAQNHASVTAARNKYDLRVR